MPWSKVGPGWELVQWVPSHGATLYLVGPNGAKYTLRTGAGAEPGTLVAWSGDKSRALFFNDDTGKVTQLNLMTGKTNTFSLTGQTSPDRVHAAGRAEHPHRPGQQRVLRPWPGTT